MAQLATKKECLIMVNAGVGSRHAAHERIDLITEEVYVMMLFHTPFEAVTANGKEKGHASQMLINPPGSHQWHRGVGEQGFTNDWVHLDASAVKEAITELALPLNEIFSVSNTSFMSRIIADIKRERLLNAPHHQEMEACRITELLLLTSRYRQIAKKMAASPVEFAHYERFCLVRQSIQERYSEPWTVDKMATMACLSPNRFAVLYKKFFGISPMNDLIDMRLSEAKWFLTQGSLTVAEVAERCGFSSLSYFSRLFKNRTGQTPKRFRI